jgi:hypothetical protein
MLAMTDRAITPAKMIFMAVLPEWSLAIARLRVMQDSPRLLLNPR